MCSKLNDIFPLKAFFGNIKQSLEEIFVVSRAEGAGLNVTGSVILFASNKMIPLIIITELSIRLTVYCFREIKLAEMY